MSLLDSLFGAGMSHIGGALGTQNNINPQNYGYQNQGLANAYTAQQAQAFRPPRWVVDGVQYHSLTDFAEAVFGDTPAKTMYILKHSDKANK